MKLAEFSGTFSPQIKAAQGFAALLLVAPYTDYFSNQDGFIEATVDIELQRVDGDNIEITKDENLHSLMATFGFTDQCIQQLPENRIGIQIPIANGNIEINEGDEFKISIKGLPALLEPLTYQLFDIKMPIPATVLFTNEKKVIGRDLVSSTISVDQYDTALFQLGWERIKSVLVTYNNGVSLEYTPQELDSLMVDAQPTLLNTRDYTLERDLPPARVLPLEFISKFTIRKDQGGHINILLTDRG